VVSPTLLPLGKLPKGSAFGLASTQLYEPWVASYLVATWSTTPRQLPGASINMPQNEEVSQGYLQVFLDNFS
jgi:hypothetical protein